MTTDTDDDRADEPAVTITVQAADEQALERLKDGYAAATGKGRAPAVADYLVNAAGIVEVQARGPDGEPVPISAPSGG